ncbi:proteasome subunit beta type-5-like [Cimex lectularius]|uniref:Proteasome subunit beta n=1 Tax=Cimex lectularius TaxID=79782 RepID=A0A8I6TJN1_CIMLE|nr:proteasome subunit beta type-5-like [Cimex lectularius]
MALEALVGIKEDLFKTDRYKVDSDSYDVGNFKDCLNLELAPMAYPDSAIAEFTQDEAGRPIKIQIDHGTTTLGFVYKNGVILAVDSRATGGKYIGSQGMKKIVEINQFLLGTMAGGAADCVYWDRVLAKQCRMYELRNKERISTAAASKIMSNMAYSYKGMGLSMGMMIAGWDKRGPSLYYVDSESTRTQGNVFSVGSGSVYAFGVLDAGYNFNLTDEDAYELGRRAIYQATFRDSYSGGLIRVYHMKNTGWECISVQDCKDLHYKYYPTE